MKQRHQIIINVVSNYTTFLIYGIANFILVGYAVRKLGKDAFGLVSLALSLTGMSEILGRGICQALIKNVAAAISRSENEKINEYLSTSVMWYSMCAIFGASICGIVAINVNHIFKIPPELITTAKIAMWMMAVRILVLFPLEAFQGILFAHQHYDLANLSKSIMVILRVLATILYFEFVRPGVISLILITIISLAFERITWVWYSFRLSKYLKIKLSLVTYSTLAMLVSFGIFMMIIDVANMIGYEMVKWVIGFELSVQDVGGYTLIASLASFVGALVRAVANVLVPVASKYDALNRHDMNKQLALLSAKYSMIMSSGLCIVPLLLIRPFLNLWVGVKYSPEYLTSLAYGGIALFIGQWVIGMAVNLLQMLTGVGKIKIPMLVTLGWAIGGLGGTWIYLHWIHNSLIAAVIGITIARIIGSLIHLIYGMYIFKVQPFTFVLDAILRPFFVSVIICIFSAIMMKYFQIRTTIDFIIVSAIMAILYILGSWILSLSSNERSNIIHAIETIMKKLNMRKKITMGFCHSSEEQ